MIWYQSSSALGKDRKFLPYENALKQHVKELSSSNGDWVFRGIDAGEVPSEKDMSIDQWRKKCFIENALKAETEGFAGFAVGCWQDHGYREIRSRRNIQVVSIAEATLHSLMMVSQHPGLVVPSTHDVGLIKDNMTFYGIDPNRFDFEVCTLDMGFLMNAFDDPSPFINSIEPAVDNLQAKSVDILAFGCGTFNEILYKNKRFEMKGIPVVDGVGILIKTMEMLLELKQKQKRR